MTTIRTKRQWLKEWFEGLTKFEWFIVEYFSRAELNAMIAWAKEEKTPILVQTMNRMWFELPDSIFNIANEDIMNKGWREFLALVEFYSEAEAEAICGKEEITTLDTEPRNIHNQLAEPFPGDIYPRYMDDPHYDDDEIAREHNESVDDGMRPGDEPNDEIEFGGGSGGGSGAGGEW